MQYCVIVLNMEKTGYEKVAGPTDIGTAKEIKREHDDSYEPLIVPADKVEYAIDINNKRIQR